MIGGSDGRVERIFIIDGVTDGQTPDGVDCSHIATDTSVIFVNENENENGEKRENNEFVNEN